MCRSRIPIFFGLMLLLPSAALAAPAIQLPKTGQTGCWDTSGNSIECTAPAAAGQDANVSAGVALPAAPRFTEPTPANGTLMDKLTDLVWLKNADCLAGSASWRQAMDRAATLENGICGLADNSAPGQWRLPNRVEMRSLANFQQPAGDVYLNGQGFTGAVHDYYWTSDIYVGLPTSRWVVHPVGDMVPDIEGTRPRYPALFVRDPRTLALTPATAAFGDVTVAKASAPQTFTIANSGAIPVTVSGVTVTGADSAMFAVTPGTGASACGSVSQPVTIQPAANCTVQVVFTPASEGAKTAALHVASNTELPVADATLTGSGIAEPVPTPTPNPTPTPTPTVQVSASVNGGNGTLGTDASQTVTTGNTVSFNVTPAQGFQPNPSVTGTCPKGSFSGNTYTTGSITAACTVGFTFLPVSAPPALTMEDALKAYLSVMGSTQLSADEKARFDVAPLGADGKPAPDGAVDVADVVIMLRRLVGAVTW